MQIRKNRCDATELRFLGDHSSKSILNKLKASQIWNRCASQERVAEIKSGANYSAAIVLEASVVREARMWHNAQIWKKQALHVSDTCLSKDIVESR